MVVMTGKCSARLSFYHLRQLRMVRRSLTTDSDKTLVHALIASRLDYCNSVLYQINTNAMKTAVCPALGRSTHHAETEI